MTVAPFFIRPLSADDQDWVLQFLIERWGSDRMIAHGVEYHPHTLPGFAAFADDRPIGLITYHIEPGSCEIVTIDSVQSGLGIGTALIEAVKDVACAADCKRVWLITTNDNLNALRFYQKRGFVLVAVHRNAIDRARQIKPEIPLIGEFGIPLRDEIELEMEI
jgi:ribosomal protein S18 acetylase RimI-like enzyme